MHELGKYETCREVKEGEPNPWLYGFEDITDNVDVKFTVELSDSESEPTWWDKLEFVYFSKLDIWMLMDSCKTVDSEEVLKGFDCPWGIIDMNYPRK